MLCNNFAQAVYLSIAYECISTISVPTKGSLKRQGKGVKGLGCIILGVVPMSRVLGGFSKTVSLQGRSIDVDTGHGIVFCY